jgi:hypothetical protein
MTQQEFSSLLGEGYKAFTKDGTTVELILKETGDLTRPSDEMPDVVRRDPFFLIFTGPPEPMLESGISKTIGPDGKEFVLSYNAEGYVDNDRQKGIQYYVVFN